MLPKNETILIRWVALIGSLVPLALSLVLWFQFQPAQAGFQFEEQYLWYEAIGSSYHLGVDGLSITMVLLTTLLTPLCILASFNIKQRVRSFMGLFLLLETGCWASSFLWTYCSSSFFGRLDWSRCTS
jgi:NADH-quinone oxidoreductase subunit M